MHQGEIRRHVTELTDHAAVLSAITEYDRLSQASFLSKHGFRKSTRYILRYEGHDYDSKAIAGVAFGIQHKTSPLRPGTGEIHGGVKTHEAAGVLMTLGFGIVGIDRHPVKPKHDLSPN
jgi:5-methylcytosine-specific restriction enzyme A